jgi:hypothetical protein
VSCELCERPTDAYLCGRCAADLGERLEQLPGLYAALGGMLADLPARMGRCPQEVHGAACGAELLLPQGQQVLRCPWCSATYPPGVWAALKVAQRVLSPAALAAEPEARPSRGSTTAGSRG